MSYRVPWKRLPTVTGRASLSLHVTRTFGIQTFNDWNDTPIIYHGKMAERYDGMLVCMHALDIISKEHLEDIQMAIMWLRR